MAMSIDEDLRKCIVLLFGLLTGSTLFFVVRCA